jgi:dihydrofolate synthase/folylpolyglutamate synthase
MKFPFWPDPKNSGIIDLGLERVFELLERLGNPHLKLPPAIHIAGTNGKGSTLSFLKEIFTQSGFKTHSYISPHLVNFNERICVAGKEISDEFLNECLQECKKAAQKKPAISVTFFEGTTIAAILAFSRVKADILLLETGMGGRLDATNILPEVLLSVITPIALDHQEFLGKTLEKIAFEKAGIIKKKCPVIIGKQKAATLKVLEKQAKKSHAPVKIFGRDWKIIKQKNGFLFEGFKKKISLPFPSLLGDHQIENASLAIAALLAQKKFKIAEKNIKTALTKTFHPARLQKITSGKFHEILPQNFELYLDGSHNPQGAETLVKFLKKQKNKKILVIFSMLKDKDCESFLKKLAPQVDELFTLEIPGEAKSRKAEEIKKIAQKLKIKSEAVKNFDDAFKKILGKKNPPESLILICGSLYLAGSFLETSKTKI